MPYAVLENAYATIDEFEQKEVVDFVFCFSKKQEIANTLFDGLNVEKLSVDDFMELLK